MQNEITTKGKLLDENGALSQRGYSKRMVLDYDRGDIKAPGHRIKEWDYYLVLCDDFAVALTVADNSYMGLVSASLIVFKDEPWEQTTSVMSFMPFGKTGLPFTSLEGDTNYKDKKCEFRFEKKGDKRRLYCRMENFKDKKPFQCDITLSDPDDESIVMATPFHKKDRAFYYNQKINCMPAEGFAEFDGKKYVFPENSFGTLDWGRGVWTYSNTWYWGSASGIVGGKRFGFNIGYGFGNTSAASENMLFYDGVAHKLEDVSFNIPMNDNGKEDYMKPWTFSSSDGRFELDFVPVIDRASCTSAVVIKSDQHQVFGRFSGKVILDSGEELVIDNLMGFAEKVLNRW